MQFPQPTYGPPVYVTQTGSPYPYAPFQQSPFSNNRSFPTFPSNMSPSRGGIRLAPITPTTTRLQPPSISFPYSPHSNERSVSMYPDDEPVRIVLQQPPPVPTLQPSRPDPWKQGHPFSAAAAEFAPVVKSPANRTDVRVQQPAIQASVPTLYAPSVAIDVSSPSKYSSEAELAIIRNHAIEYQEAPPPDQRHMMYIKSSQSNPISVSTNVCYFLSVCLFVAVIVTLSYGLWIVSLICGLIWLVLIHPLFLHSLTKTDDWAYLSNIIDFDTLHRHVNRLTQTNPTIQIVVNCFHMEKRTTTHRKKGGGSSTSTSWVKKIAFTETCTFPTAAQPHEWSDESDTLIDLASASTIRVKFAPAINYAGGYKGGLATSALAAVKRQLVQQHQSKDEKIEIIDSLQVEGAEQKFLVLPATGGIFRPILLNKTTLFICAALLLLAPYRIYYKLVTSKMTFRIRKKLTVFPNQS